MTHKTDGQLAVRRVRTDNAKDFGLIGRVFEAAFSPWGKRTIVEVEKDYDTDQLTITQILHRGSYSVVVALDFKTARLDIAGKHPVAMKLCLINPKKQADKEIHVAQQACHPNVMPIDHKVQIARNCKGILTEFLHQCRRFLGRRWV